MPSLADHHSNQSVKLLYIGDSSTGKTGSLASLANAGYKLRIIDIDNGLDVLKNVILHSPNFYDPKCLNNIQYISCNDSMKSVNGKLMPLKAVGWAKAMNALYHWKDGEVDLGKVSEWGPDTVLVIDSLSSLSTLALNFHLSMNGALGLGRTQNEARRDIGSAQNLIRDLLQMLYDPAIKCNVICISHVTFVDEQGHNPGTDEAKGQSMGYPSAIGRALSPHIPRWFNSMLVARLTGAGQSAKAKIYTKSQMTSGGQIIGAKNTNPFKVADSYPIETGLADYFKAVTS